MAPSFEQYAIARTPALLRFAYLLSRDQGMAEDLVQEALSRAHQHWHRIQRRDDPDVYVRKIVLNQLLSWRRRSSWSREISVDLPPEAIDARDTPREQADRDAAWRMLATLPPRQRAVLVLRYYEDLDDRRIALILECTPATVRSHAAQALARLRLVDAATPISLEETR